MIIENNVAPSISKVVIKHKNENKFYKFENNFLPSENNDKIDVDNSVVNDEKNINFFHKEEDIFYCESEDNQIDNLTCLIENELCPNCQRLNQKYHKLKPNYLINGAGRVCTYRKGKMFCLGKFERIKKEAVIQAKGKESEIVYKLNLTCNGKNQQCGPCERMQKFMDKYYEPKILEKLLKRDAQFGY